MICEEFSCFIGPALSSSERRYLQLVLFSPSSAARYNKRNLKWQYLTATQADRVTCNRSIQDLDNGAGGLTAIKAQTQIRHQFLRVEEIQLRVDAKPISDLSPIKNRLSFLSAFFCRAHSG